MRFSALFLLISTVFVFNFFSTSGTAEPSDVLAIVGNHKITQKDFDLRYQEVLSKTINPPTKGQFLEDLVRYEIGLQEAEKRNLRDDVIVKERINQEIYKGLIERELAKEIEQIKITEKEMKAYYKNNPEIRTSHILIQLKPDANTQEKASAKKRADEIFDEVRKSKKDFKDLVKLYTDDAFNRDNGGDVGWQTRVTLVPNYYEAALKLKEGRISPLIETQFGFHIIQLTGIRDYSEANKAQIRAALFDEKRKLIFNNYFADLKKKYSIKIVKKPD